MKRRDFIKAAGVLGCSAAASPLITPVSFASAPWDNRLVVILLRGAMDGLEVVQPYGDASLKAYRSNLQTGPNTGGIDLDGFYAMHAGLTDLLPLWRAGELGFAHAVSTPYRDKRSHFDGQDLLEAGIPDAASIGQVRDGWLNRLLQSQPGVHSQTAFAVGQEKMIILSGSAPSSGWTPNARLDLSPQARRLLDQLYAKDSVFHASSEIALELAEAGVSQSLDTDSATEMSMQDMVAAASDQRKASAAKVIARFAAERLVEETRIASFSIGGWDTHLNQRFALRRALSELSSAILTLRVELGSVWQKTTILAMTEFGRTVRENGSKGTDHGTGGAMLLAGGAVRGGKVYGRWPGLSQADLYKDRDLLPTEDVRAYAASAMRGLFGLPQDFLETKVFPSLTMENVPHIIT